MPETQGQERNARWDRDVYEHVGEPLRPEAVGSIFIIVPGNSGDVVLATSVVRWIKARNPDCRVSFAVKRSNLPLLAMCPGVDEAVEIPTLTFLETPARHVYLERYAGRAEAVIYPVCVFEDLHLLRRYNFMETLWLLSGVPGGMPAGPHPLWLSPPDAAATAAQVLERCTGAGYADELAAEARRQPAQIVRHLLEKRTARNAGWKNARRLRGYASFVRSLGPTGGTDAARKYVIVSSDSNAVPAPPPSLFEEVVRFLRERGRIVLQNVIDPIHALPGTVPLVCSYPEFVSLRQVGVPFVGWRSGLCDIAAASPAPMCVLYPPRVDNFWVGLAANCETVMKSFGFASMNVACDCVEMDCYGPKDLDRDKLATILRA